MFFLSVLDYPSVSLSNQSFSLSLAVSVFKHVFDFSLFPLSSRSYPLSFSRILLLSLSLSLFLQTSGADFTPRSAASSAANSRRAERALKWS